jgi:metal-dependent amidase/aminoacylase/carboxypeptidase family protein
LEIALERVTNTKTSAADRVMWSRIVIAGGQACNSVLRDAEIWLLLRAEERYVDKSLAETRPCRLLQGTLAKRCLVE